MSSFRSGRWTVVGYSMVEDLENQRSLTALAAKMTVLESEVVSSPAYRSKGPVYVLWLTAGVPLIAAWKKFYAEQVDSYGERSGTSKATYDSWQARIDTVRDAIGRMTKLVLPTPAAPPHPTSTAPAPTVPAPAPPPVAPPVRDPGLDAASDKMGMGKALAIGGIAVGAVVFLALAASMR